MKKEDFSKSIFDKKEIPKMCSSCGEDDPRVLRKSEEHHIFGKSNSDETTLLCLNCHAKITSKQNKLSVKKRKNKLAFQLITQGELLKLIGERQIKIALELLKNGKDVS